MNHKKPWLWFQQWAGGLSSGSLLFKLLDLAAKSYEAENCF